MDIMCINDYIYFKNGQKSQSSDTCCGFIVFSISHEKKKSFKDIYKQVYVNIRIYLYIFAATPSN